MTQLQRPPSLLEREVKVDAQSSAGRISPAPGRKRMEQRAKIGVAVVLMLVACVLVYSSFRSGDPTADTNVRTGIDSVTGKTFDVRIVENDRFPWTNPDTGDRTLYPAEKCFWTRDGKATLKPTLVFVKAYAGINEKTICPDCGHEVRQHNPMPPGNLMAEAAKAEAGVEDDGK